MLIVGCGDVGRKIASGAIAHAEPVFCLVGSPASADALRGEGLTARAVDLDHEAPALDRDWDQGEIFYLAPPPPAGDTDPRMQRFLQSLPRDRRHRIVYISTSGVYGNCAGGWVDETRPANPQVDRARRRLSAERQLLARISHPNIAHLLDGGITD